MNGKIYLEYEKQKKIISSEVGGMGGGILMLLFGFFLYCYAIQGMNSYDIVGLLSMYWIVFGVLIFLGSTKYFRDIKVLNEMIEKIKKVK